MSGQAEKEERARWVNACAFEARCTAAGFDEGHKHRFTHMASTIQMGIDTDADPHHSGTPAPDYHVIGAAQYILVAGDVIDAECVRRQLPFHHHHGFKGWADGNGPAVWKRWGDRLAEIADALDGGGELPCTLYEETSREALRDMVDRARDKMVALEPQLFAQSDSGGNQGTSISRSLEGLWMYFVSFLNANSACLHLALSP